jgi:hypothetical protein
MRYVTWWWKSFHNVYAYEIIMQYTLNLYKVLTNFNEAEKKTKKNSSVNFWQKKNISCFSPILLTA